MISFTIPGVIGSVDHKVGGVDVVALQRSLKQFGVVHSAVSAEEKLLVLS